MLRIYFGIVLNKTLVSSIFGINFKGKFKFSALHCVKGKFPSIDESKTSSNPKQIPRIGK